LESSLDAIAHDHCDNVAACQSAIHAVNNESLFKLVVGQLVETA